MLGRRLLLIGGGALSAAAVAAESALRVPISPLGRVVYLEQERPRGALVEMLEELGRRSGLALDMPVVPRARLLQMYLQAPGSDLLVPIAQGRSIEGLGDFVPLLRVRPTLILPRRRLAQAPADVRGLLASDWQGLRVRAAATSDDSEAVWQALAAQHRVTLVRDWATVLRMLLAGRADFTLFAPSLMQGETALFDAATREQLAWRPIAGLELQTVGVLLSDRRLDAARRAMLRGHLQAMVRDGTVRRAMQRHHAAELLAVDTEFLD